MADKKREESSGSGPRYVWDPNKLAWVETTEERVTAKVPVEQPREKDIEEVVPEDVTAEAMVEAPVLQYRGAWVRLAAFIIDFVILTIIVTIIDAVGTVPNWTGVVIGFAYFVGFWSWRGQTPGKILLGAKIVKLDGSPISPIIAIIRWLVYLIPSFAVVFFVAGALGFIRDNLTLFVALVAIISLVVIGLSKTKRGIHDVIAGTCVISTRRRAPQPEEIEFSDTTKESEQPDTSEPKTAKQE